MATGKAKELKKLEKSQGLLSKWLNHEFNGQLYDIPVRLRLSKDGKQIETTKGAKVETAKALVLLEKLQKFDAVGENINGFTVIENTLDHVKIGCHVIAWPVINQVFKQVNWRAFIKRNKGGLCPFYINQNQRKHGKIYVFKIRE